MILAGGRNSRIGENKAFLRLGGHRVIDVLLDKFLMLFNTVILVTNEPKLYEAYEREGEKTVKIVTDVIPDKGPMSGIHAGLVYAPDEWIMVAACDMPFISMELASYMVDRMEGFDGVVPRVKGRPQPLFALYNKRCLAVMDECLRQDKLKISRVYEELDILYIEEEEILRFGDPDVFFFNINTKNEFDKAVEIAGGVITRGGNAKTITWT